jgi:hypothetical protein
MQTTPTIITGRMPRRSASAPAIGLRDAPHQLRDSECQADRGVADRGLRVDRGDEERLRLTDAQAEREHRPAAMATPT